MQLGSSGKQQRQPWQKVAVESEACSRAADREGSGYHSLREGDAGPMTSDLADF